MSDASKCEHLWRAWYFVGHSFRQTQGVNVDTCAMKVFRRWCEICRDSETMTGPIYMDYGDLPCETVDMEWPR